MPSVPVNVNSIVSMKIDSQEASNQSYKMCNICAIIQIYDKLFSVAHLMAPSIFSIELTLSDIQIGETHNPTSTYQ